MVKKAAQATPNQLLRRARLERGWIQRAVAEFIGAPQDTMVTRWERGTAFPSAYYIERLCQLFELSPNDLGLVAETDSAEPLLPVEKRDAEPGLKPQPVSVDPIPEPVSSFVSDPAIPQVTRNKDHLVGRIDLLDQVKQLLTEPADLTAIALHGLPGVGKTTLAAMLAADPDIQECFPGGILWAGLGPIPNLQGVLERWATLLNVPIPQGERAMKQEELIQQLRLTIGRRRMLLIIDDGWTEQEALALHMGGDHSMHLLTTHLPQVAFAFAPRSLLHVPELDALMGTQLLEQYVPSLVKEQPEAINDLVSAVGGLPLALTLLGRYLAAQALSGQPRRLQTALQRLRERQYRFQISMPLASSERSLESPSPTSLSLHTAIALSTQTLDAETLRVFCALSVFPAKPASFTEEAALAVTQCSLDTQEQARQIQHPALLSLLLMGQGDCLIIQRDYIQARQVLQEAVALVRQIKHADYLCKSLNMLGVAIAYVEDYDHAIAYFQESLALAQQLSEPLRLISLLVEWGETALFHDRFSAAREHFQEVLTLDAENQHYPDRQALAHYGLARIAWHEQDVKKAYEHATESLRLFQQVGHYKAQEVQAWLDALVKDRPLLLMQH